MTLNSLTIAAIVLGGAALGLVAGFVVRQVLMARQLRAAHATAQERIEEAETEGKQLVLKAKEEALALRNQAEEEARERRNDFQRQERRVARKEEQVDRRGEALERREKTIAEKEEALDRLRAQAEAARTEQVRELERVAQLSVDQAREMLLARIDEEIRTEASRRVREAEETVQTESTERAYKIMAHAMQRYANDVVSELTSTVIQLPGDEMKGRLIGREGRNIRALENATGVNLIVDDTPEVVTISAFDPVRREVARLAITRLIQDGRIQPARIEEEVERSRQEIDQVMQKAGEEACFEVGVHGLHPELVKTMGRLRFRSSYGQNVLRHSIEVAHIAGAIAAELRTSQDVARRAGFLHDIGKALSHEVEGPHALIGGELLERHGVSPRIVRAVADHHGEEGWKSVDAFIVAAADAISSARPGARRENAEAYVKRLEMLEQIASGFDGVEKAYAIQAGREVRVMVRPEQIDDLGAMRLARDICKKVQESMEYPGQIKVIVIRETRAIEYAR